MGDEEQRPIAVTGVVPTPAPLPVDSGPSGAGRRKIAAIVGSVVLATLVACGLTALLVYTLSRSIPPDGAAVPPVVGTAPASNGGVTTNTLSPGDAIGSVMWAGGRYVVAQQWDARAARPVVTVWDARTSSRRDATGYRVVAVEPGSTRLWLVPDDGRALVDAVAAAKRKPPEPSVYDVAGVSGPVNDVAGDGVDSPHAAMVLWDVSAAGLSFQTPTDVAWRRWAGPGAWGLEIQVDARVGAYPTTLAFTRNDGSGQKVPAQLPALPGVRTWEPVAWSPSGSYLIVRPLTVTTEQAPPDMSTLPMEIVIDARSGAVCPWAATVQTQYSTMDRPRIQWDDRTDALYGVMFQEETGAYVLGMVTPEKPVMEVPLMDSHGQWLAPFSSEFVSLTAADPGAPMITETDWDEPTKAYIQSTWIVRAGVARLSGHFKDAGAGGSKYSPAAGMFVAPESSGDHTTGYRLLHPDGSPAGAILIP